MDRDKQEYRKKTINTGLDFFEDTTYMGKSLKQEVVRDVRRNTDNLVEEYEKEIESLNKQLEEKAKLLDDLYEGLENGTEIEREIGDD